ncbi:MAG: serine/threonine-protein kinase, partial [Phycisphaerae bacterium]
MSSVPANPNEPFERVYLAPDEGEERSETELAAARALSAYRAAQQAGEPVSAESFIAAAPHAAEAIRQAIEAYEFINQAGTQPGGAAGPTAPERFPELPGYQILRVVGQGGMGVVYGAMQESLQRAVAIKVLSPRLERQPDVIARFQREIQLLTRLTHPNIVDIIDAGVIDGRHYYVMEYVAGLSLERILRKHRVRPRTAVSILKQIVTGLVAAHRQGILHRDLKPGNILLDRYAVVRIADFGLAAIVAERGGPDSNTRTDAPLGTLGYMSPEQLADAASCTERSDLYSVGVIFYQMLTGQLPAGRFAPASTLVPGLTRAADKLIERCLASDPAERYPSAEALLRSVGRLERRIDRTRKRMLELMR